MNLVSRLILVLSIAVAGASLAACGKSKHDPAFYRFEGHYMILFRVGLARDPETGNPLYFVFVNNTNSLTADGSYEHPYPTLALAEANSGPNNIIYVFPGDGATTGMNSGIALQANQKFWGAGNSHVIQTRSGRVTIPALASSAPKITNTGGNGITLATDNDIGGFTLLDAADNGIFGADPKSVTISSCTINNSQTDQIHLEYSTSAGSISLDSLTLTNGNFRTIFISSTVLSPSMVFTLNNSVIRGSAAQSIDASFTNEVNVRLTNNTVEGNNASSLITLGGPATLSVSGNTLNNNTSVSDAPLSVTAGTGPLSAVIDGNTVSGNTAGALRFILNDTESVLSVTGNTLANNGTGAIASLGAAIFINPNSTSSGNCTLVLSENIISGNTGSAFYGFDGGFNNFQVTAANNRITGNGGSGFVFANATNSFTLTATNNVISGGGDHGITTAGGLAMATARMTLSNNQITGNTNSANGIALSHTGTNLYFTATNNEISDNESSGIILYSSGSIGNVVASIENNTINNNQNLGGNTSGGIDLEQFTNLSAALNGNALSNNVSNDVFIGSAEASPSVCLGMSGNNSNMGYVLSSGAGVFDLAPTNVASVNVGTITEIGTITLVPACP